MPKPFPKEFRDDVVAIALKRESSFAQIANDFGISESCVQRWVKIARSTGAGGPVSARAKRPRTVSCASA